MATHSQSEVMMCDSWIAGRLKRGLGGRGTAFGAGGRRPAYAYEYTASEGPNRHPCRPRKALAVPLAVHPPAASIAASLTRWLLRFLTGHSRGVSFGAKLGEAAIQPRPPFPTSTHCFSCFTCFGSRNRCLLRTCLPVYLPTLRSYGASVPHQTRRQSMRPCCKRTQPPTRVGNSRKRFQQLVKHVARLVFYGALCRLVVLSVAYLRYNFVYTYAIYSNLVSGIVAVTLEIPHLALARLGHCLRSTTPYLRIETSVRTELSCTWEGESTSGPARLHYWLGT